VARLEGHVLVAPGTRHDQDRRHAAELGGEGALVLLVALLLALLLLLGVTAPDDRVVGAIGAGHVQGVDLGVIGEVGADLGAAVDHGEESVVDE
jgi:hypothetical protein